MSTLTKEQKTKIQKSAANVGTVLSAYALIVGDLAGEKDVLIVDLLADIQHYCDANRIDFKRVQAHSRNHYIAEVNGDA